MRPEDICWADAGAIAKAVQSGKLNAVDVVEATLDRIASVDPKLGAFVTVGAEAARAAAKSVDAKRAAGDPLGPLAGVPVSLKDIVLTADMPTKAGSKVRLTTMPDETDAVVVSRLKSADAIIIGKTTTPEFCHKTITTSPLTGEAHNPWDLERTPGGSSGGSAAAVAAGLGQLSIGTDGGGSIRLPAALCGVVGFKPTFGLVPQWPTVPGWDLLGHMGPLARSVADIERAMQVIAGPDVRDPASLIATRKASRAKPRVVWARSLDDMEGEPEVEAALHEVVQAARGLVGQISEEILDWSDPDQQFRNIVTADIAAGLGQLLGEPGNRDVMDPSLVQMIEFGQKLTGSDLARALAWQRAFAARVLGWFEDVDILIVPTAPVTAFPLGMIGPRMIAGRKTSPFAWFNWTWPFNATGQPALSLPVVLGSSLPVGIQIVGRRGEDALVTAFARQLEKRLNPAQKPRPAL